MFVTIIFKGKDIKNSIELTGVSLSQLQEYFLSWNVPKFRAQQVCQWIYERKVTDFSSMHNLGKDLLNKLQSHFAFPVLKEKKKQFSSNGETGKFLFELKDGSYIESVLIYAPNRASICISTQVGCRGRCAICASGKQGLIRNLTVAEIIEQFLFVQKNADRPITHIVFMGMGEPLDNFDAVCQSIVIFNKYLEISQRRMTISTVGITDKIRLLQNKNFKVNLALSLHAPTQQLREKIIPLAKENPLPQLLKTLDDYSYQTKRDITYEYTLIENINDRPSHAKELIQLLGKRHVSVNLIPFNPIENLQWKRPSKEQIIAFKGILEKGHVSTTWRYAKGVDIQAACGQLAFQGSS